MATTMKPEAYVTLVATDSYVKGAVVLAYSIRNLGTTKLLICLVTPDLEKENLTQLHKVFDHVLPITKLDTNDIEKLALLGRPELGLTVTKVHIWSLDWLETVLFLDADTLVLKSLDHLFDTYREIKFAACPDPGWPDCFNSGVFVCKPNRSTYLDLVGLLATQGSFDGGDQGLLNTYFSDWSQTANQRMPFIYNVTPNAVYSYAPAYQKNSENIAVMHFIGENKPWDSEPIAQKNTPSSESTATQTKEDFMERKLQPKKLADTHPLKDHSGTPGSVSVKVDHQTYLDKWWEIYRTNISGMTDSLDSLGLQKVDEHASRHPDENKSQENLHEHQSFHHSTPAINYSGSVDVEQGNYGDTLAAFSTRYNLDTAYRTLPTSHNDYHGYDRPILYQPALNNLSERNMLTPAHQQASEYNKPFPLFEEYLRPRSQPQILRHSHNESGKSPEPSKKGARYPFPPSNLDQKTPLSDRKIRNQVADRPTHSSRPKTANQVPQPTTENHDSGSWKSIPIEFLPEDSDDFPNGVPPHFPMNETERYLSNSVNKIQLGVPWSAKLICTASKPRPTPTGEFQTTYTLVWDDPLSSSVASMAASPRLDSTPRPPKSTQNHNNIIRPSYSNSPHLLSPFPASPASEEEPNSQYIPVHLPTSDMLDFGTYRVQWDQPELKGWSAPNLNQPIKHAQYLDSEDPHDQKLRRQSISSSGIQSPKRS